MTNEYISFFNFDKKELSNYLNQFNKHIINPRLFKQLKIKKSADKGNLNSIKIYIQMMGFEFEDSESVKYMKVAADKEDNWSMYSYGMMLYRGIKIRKKKERSS